MKKYVIRILYDAKGWAYYHRACALQKYAPDDFEVSIGPDYGKALKEKRHHLVFQLAYSYAKDLRHHCDKAGHSCLIVSSYNIGWGYANKWLGGTMKPSHAVIINNYEMWDKAGRLPSTYHISNGVDRRIFKVATPILKRPAKVMWVGSRIHQQVKGYKDFLVPLQTMLRKKNIDLELKLTNSMSKRNLTLPQMAQWYNTGRIYVVASKTEGTPNPALEAASCGCVVVSTKVGNMPELIKNGVNGYLCNRNLNELYGAILKANENIKPMSDAMVKEIAPWNWQQRSVQFYDLFRQLIEDPQHAPKYKPTVSIK